MRRLACVALLAVSACKPPPQIDSFTVDNPNPIAGQPVLFSFAVRGANSLSIVPDPGPVTASPVSVQPRAPGRYTLRASNAAGSSSKDLLIGVVTTAAATVEAFSVVPSQAPAGTPRTLSWKLKNGLNGFLSGGALGQLPIHATGTATDAPGATTVYTLTATSGKQFLEQVVTRQAVARVVEPSAISLFAASPAAIAQGDSTTLTWDGTALNWTVLASDAAMPTGNRKSLLVQPAVTTTYSLSGTGPGGPVGPKQVTVTVTPNAGSTLSYSPPLLTAQSLELVAKACPAPCSVLTLRIVAVAPVALRGVAVNLPLDATKVSLDPSSFGSALDAGKAVLGSGPLQGTLVLGAAKLGSGTAPAADSSFAAGDEVAHFSLALQAQGGKGVVFDGASAFAAFIQSAKGRTPGGIAVGRLEAQ